MIVVALKKVQMHLGPQFVGQRHSFCTFVPPYATTMTFKSDNQYVIKGQTRSFYSKVCLFLLFFFHKKICIDFRN